MATMILKHKTYPSPLLYAKDGSHVNFGGYVPHFTEVEEEVGKGLLASYKGQLRKVTRAEFTDAEEAHLEAIGAEEAARAEAARDR